MSQLTITPTANPTPSVSPQADPNAVRRYAWVRVGFGLIWAIDATLKWLPGFRHHYLLMIQAAGHGQPAWLSGWFAFWSHTTYAAPTVFAVLIALTESAIALSLIFGIAQRLGYAGGIAFALLVWGVGEGFGGPYSSGATDIGAAIMYAALLAALWLVTPAAARAAAPAVDHRLARYRRLRWTTFECTVRPGRS